jgi:hypothetical protein
LIFRAEAALLNDLLTDPAVAKAGLPEKILVLDSGTPMPLNRVVFAPVDRECEWKDLINDLLDGPDGGDPSVIQASEKARGALYRYFNETLALMKTVPEEDRSFIASRPMLAWRLTLALQLCAKEPLDEVPLATAEAAIVLAQLLGEEQTYCMRRYRAAREEKARLAAADIMFEKIAEAKQIPVRALCRLYPKHSRAIHGPIINLLVRQGRIREDAEGCLVPAKAAGDGQKSIASETVVEPVAVTV